MIFDILDQLSKVQSDDLPHWSSYPRDISIQGIKMQQIGVVKHKAIRRAANGIDKEGSVPAWGVK
jgi:hypothetical protein